MRLKFAVALLVLGASTAAADVVVRCDRGQSLGRTLSVLPKDIPMSVSVYGTCTEYVTISGFEGLTVRGASGAIIRQPAVRQDVTTGALTISASRGVTVEGLTIETTLNDGTSPGVWVHDGSTNLRLRRMSVVGTGPGVYVSDMSEVSIAGLTIQTGGWGAIGIWHSKASVEDSLLQNPHDDYQSGIQVGQNGVLLIHGTKIRHMWVGINAVDGGVVNVQDVNDELPFGGPSEVVIDDPPSIHLWGLDVRNGGLATLNAKLRILTPGSWWGGETGGVQVDGASSLTGGQNLEVHDSQGQGVLVKNNSHASLGGAQIISTGHGAVVAFNHATVDLGDASAMPPISTTITGSGAYDLYCDSTSLITGTANAPGATKVDCSTTRATPGPPLP